MTDLKPDLSLLRSYAAADDLAELPPTLFRFARDGRELFFVYAVHGLGSRTRPAT